MRKSIKNWDGGWWLWDGWWLWERNDGRWKKYEEKDEIEFEIYFDKLNKEILTSYFWKMKMKNEKWDEKKDGSFSLSHFFLPSHLSISSTKQTWDKKKNKSIEHFNGDEVFKDIIFKYSMMRERDEKWDEMVDCVRDGLDGWLWDCEMMVDGERWLRWDDKWDEREMVVEIARWQMNDKL